MSGIGPLSGIRVLDVGTYAVGPSAAAYLGYLGCDVIRIENPAGEGFMDLDPTMDGMAASYINANMQKRSIHLNLRDDEDLRKAHLLADNADILIENRLPGVIDRLGLSYETVSASNPGVIFLSMPGFAPDGPFAGRPSLDMEMQALSGFASIEGAEGGPGEMFRVYAHLDHTTAIALAQAAVLGLLNRRRTGRGRHIVVTFMGSSAFLQSTRIAEYMGTGSPPRPSGSASPWFAPSQSFPCLDQVYINISAQNDAAFHDLCEVLDAPGLLEDQRFGSDRLRLANRTELGIAISKVTTTRPSWWWLRELRKRRVPCGELYTFESLRTDPHFIGQGLVREIPTKWGKIVRGGHPWKFSLTPCPEIEPAHEPGSDSEEVLAELRSLAEKP